MWPEMRMKILAHPKGVEPLTPSSPSRSWIECPASRHDAAAGDRPVPPKAAARPMRKRSRTAVFFRGQLSLEDQPCPLSKLCAISNNPTPTSRMTLYFGQRAAELPASSPRSAHVWLENPLAPGHYLRWPPLLGQELGGVKIESRRLMMPGYAARSLVSDGITLPA
jgi:hypothetical protein